MFGELCDVGGKAYYLNSSSENLFFRIDWTNSVKMYQKKPQDKEQLHVFKCTNNEVNITNWYKVCIATVIVNNSIKLLFFLFVITVHLHAG